MGSHHAFVSDARRMTAARKTMRYCVGNKKSQRGVALITAVLITAVIAMAAVAMAAQQKLDVRRTANMIDGGRAYVFALGVESWVQQVLMRDRRDNQIDDLSEPWAKRLPAITVEGAVIGGRLDDLQGRFNLNNLVDQNKPSLPDVERFQRLLAAVAVDPNLTNAIVDWIDPDAETGFPEGAEDAEYLRATPAYRAANRPMASASELLLVRGVTADIYQKLAPLVTALPTRTAININTAPPAVLMSLGLGVTEADAEALIEARQKEPFLNVQTFLQHPALAGRKVPQEGLSVSSDYFLLDAAAQFGRGHARLYSVLFRGNNNSVQVMARGQGTY